MRRFPFDEKKALEALVFVAKEWPGITPFYAAKVFFFADKAHLNRYARPVVGDLYIAMKNGPVPSVIYDWFKGKFDFTGDPDSIVDALDFNRNGFQVAAYAKREPDLDCLSRSDQQALRDALSFCEGKGFRHLSETTHRDAAWQSAPLNGEMDPRLMIEEGDERERVIEEVEEFARYGVA